MRSSLPLYGGKNGELPERKEEIYLDGAYEDEDDEEYDDGED